MAWDSFTQNNFINPDEIKSLYQEYVPAITNLYTVEIMSVNSDQDFTQGASQYLKFHAPSVTIGSPGLKFERDKITKLFKIGLQDAYTRIESLDITWREADDWRVRKYHEAWLAKFYDVELDCFISHDDAYTAGLYRTIRITLPKTLSNDTISMTAESGPYGKYNHILEFLVLPTEAGTIQLGWVSNPAVVTSAQKYNVVNWRWVEETPNTIAASQGEMDSTGLATVARANAQGYNAHSNLAADAVGSGRGSQVNTATRGGSATATNAQANARGFNAQTSINNQTTPAIMGK